MADNMHLWDDNPTQVDLLGFQPIVEVVWTALNSPEMNPVTIGVHAPWGSGKSTILGLLEKRLSASQGNLVIRLDPWEFDDQFDVRGSVIGEILQALLSKEPDNADISKRVSALRARISWSRIAVTLTRGSLVTQSEELIKALTPVSKEDPKSLAGFRNDFHDLLDEMSSVDRLVVLVDDLDRCLPGTVMATLEAIKLFLAVKKVVFILAADQDMVRESIAASLHGTGRGDQFALRYLEKIVQVPLSLPRISSDEAEAFLALLLSARYCTNRDSYNELVSHAQARRAKGQAPVLADMQSLPWQPDGEVLALASRLAMGLSAQRAASPRSIKRFLNAFALRTRIAEGQGIDIDPSVIAKLMLLEDSYRTDFEVLVALSDAERAQFLEHWQAWSRGDREDKPEKISEASRSWAAAEPDLTGAPIGRYLSLAASLVSLVAAASLTQEQLTWMSHLSSESELHRSQALERVLERPVEEQRAIMRALVERGRRSEEPEPLLLSLVHLAKENEVLRPEAVEGLWNLRDLLTPSAAFEIADSEIDTLRDLAERLINATNVEEMAKQACREALGA